MATCGAAFTVRFLRNGDQIYVAPNIVNENGDGTTLMQVVDTNSGTVAPDWTIAANQPILRLRPRSSAGYPISIKEVRWAYKGVDLMFGILGTSWSTSTSDSRFQSRITADGYCDLRICSNLASKDEVGNHQITYSIEYVSNTLTDTVTGSVDVQLQTGGSNSYMMAIAASVVELDSVSTQSTLSVDAYYGAEKVGINGTDHSLQWYKDGVLVSGISGSTYTVTRDAITGGSLIVAVLKKGTAASGTEVARDSQRISDVADEYQIRGLAASGSPADVTLGQNAVRTLQLQKNGVPVSENVSFAWAVYNLRGAKTYPDGDTMASGSTVTVKPEYCNIAAEGEEPVYMDVDVQVTATF